MEGKRAGRPPDGGWGWVVIAGCFIILMTLSMFSFSYSILFSDFLLSRGASSTTIAWIFNLHIFLSNAIGVFTGPVTKEFGFRRVSLFGCGLAVVFTFVLVFVDSLWGLLVLFAFEGAFGGLGVKPCYLLLTSYFDRKRGRANAFLMAGVCCSQFIGPPLIRYLLLEYGRQGATLLLCGVVLQCIVAASLFQPVEWHMKVDVEDANVEDEAQEKREHEDDTNGETDEIRAKESAARRKKRGVGLFRGASELSLASLAVSNMDLANIPPVSRRGSYLRENTSSKNSPDHTTDNPCGVLRGFLRTSVRVVKDVVSSMKILKSPRALIIVVGGMLSVNAYINFLMTVPFAIQSAGHSLSDAAWCLSVAGVTNLVSRLICSSLSDQSWFNIRFAYMAGAAIISLSCAVFGFLRSLTHMQVAMAAWGCGVGIHISLVILIMPHIMGEEKMAAIFGVNSLMYSISMLVVGPLFGFIRDATGSYVTSMLAMGCCGGLSVLLWCFMPAAVAYDERKEAEQRRGEEREGLAEV